MINMRDRSITQILAKMSFDQVFDLTAGVDFNIICDLNLLKEPSTLPTPTPVVPPRSLLLKRLTYTIEIRQSNKHFHALDITSLSF